jgi:uncharacterized protein (DUF2141 family)
MAISDGPSSASASEEAAIVDGAIHDGRAVCEFPRLPAGDYAIASYHDENGNGKLDLNFIGIPKEGVASSRNAKGVMGPPKFKDARFTFAGGTLELSARMKY